MRLMGQTLYLSILAKEMTFLSGTCERLFPLRSETPLLAQFVVFAHLEEILAQEIHFVPHPEYWMKFLME